MSGWAIKVVWTDGEEEYLHEGLTTKPAFFRSRSAAIAETNFLEIGLEDDCQSINVVPYPKLAAPGAPEEQKK